MELLSDVSAELGLGDTIFAQMGSNLFANLIAAVVYFDTIAILACNVKSTLEILSPYSILTIEIDVANIERLVICSLGLACLLLLIGHLQTFRFSFLKELQGANVGITRPTLSYPFLSFPPWFMNRR